MSEPCCNHNCNQGRDCPNRKPMKLSPLLVRAAIAHPFAEVMVALLAVGMVIKRAEEKHSHFMYFTALYFIPFQGLNFLFNAFIGSFIFWEKPRTFFFTDRCEYHKYYYIPNSRAVNGSAESQKLALYYCRRMDRHDPGHCK